MSGWIQAAMQQNTINSEQGGFFRRNYGDRQISRLLDEITVCELKFMDSDFV